MDTRIDKHNNEILKNYRDYLEDEYEDDKFKYLVLYE